MKPKVLVYIPIFNYAQYVRECLNSVISQTYKKQEVVVSFNGTTDGGDEIVRKEYPMVKVLSFPFHHVNPGLETTLKNSDYEVYVPLGADDKMAPNFWEQVLPLFEPDTGFVRVGYYQFSDNLPEGSYWKPLPLNSPEEILEGNKVFFSSPVRRVVWEDVGGYDHEQDRFSDWDFWIKVIMVKGWKWKTLDKPMIWYRRHASSKTETQDEQDHMVRMQQKWGSLCDKYGVIYSQLKPGGHLLK